MAMELVREPLRINHSVGDELIQFAVHGDIIVPDVKPDITRILSVDSDTMVNSTEVLAERVVVDGMVNFNIVYLCNDDERPVRSLNASLPFKEPVDLPGARQGMAAVLDFDTLNTEYEILNERKLAVKAISQIRVRVDGESEIALLSDIKGVENIQKLNQNIRICCYIGREHEQCVVKEEVELPSDNPPIFEVLRNDVRVARQIEVSDNRIAVNGEVNIDTLYAADDEEKTIQSVENIIPFTHFVDMAGVHENAQGDVDVNIKNISAKITEDEEGTSRVLDYEIVLDIEARGYEWLDKEIVVDAYCPSCRMETEHKQAEISQPENEANEQMVVKDTVQLPEKEEVKQVYSVICKPSAPETKVMDDKISIEGVVDMWVFYSAGVDGKTECYKHEAPYSSTVDAKGARPDMTCRIKMEVDQCGHTFLSGGEIEMRVILAARAKLYKNTQVKTINSIDQLQHDEKEINEQPSMIIYYAKPDDTLWKIGKKFGTTVEDLVKLNDIGTYDQLSNDQQILIHKRVI